jgi:hypothetical protein
MINPMAAPRATSAFVSGRTGEELASAGTRTSMVLGTLAVEMKSSSDE